METTTAQKKSNNMSENKYLQVETKIVNALKSVYDPEIPVNVYDLGLIYKIDVDESNDVIVTMTLTAPNCPIADQILIEVEQKIRMLDEISEVTVNLTFEPSWNMDMMSEEAKLELGLL